MKNNCNLTTCCYNQYGKCTNEEKQKECVETSKKVLCLNTEKNTTEENYQKEIVYRYCILSDSDMEKVKEKFSQIDFSEKSLIKLTEQIREKGIEMEFLQMLRELA